MIVPADHAKAFLAAIARDAFNRKGALTYSDLQGIVKEADFPVEEGHWT